MLTVNRVDPFGSNYQVVRDNGGCDDVFVNVSIRRSNELVRILKNGIYLLLNTVFRCDEDDVTSYMAPVHMLCDRTGVKIIARDSPGSGLLPFVSI